MSHAADLILDPSTGSGWRLLAVDKYDPPFNHLRMAVVSLRGTTLARSHCPGK